MAFQFDSLSAFFWMTTEGRIHGPYVWAAYVITFGGIAGIALHLVFSQKRFFKTLAAISRRELKTTDSAECVADLSTSVRRDIRNDEQDEDD
ncbi:MAG: heme exporter protein CcmD [Agarilytica sp.]